MATDFSGDARFDNPRAVQLRLAGFDHDRLVELGRNVRGVFVSGSPAADRVERLVDDAYLSDLADAVAGRLGGQVGVALRLYLKKLVGDVLDRVELFDDFDPRRDYELTVGDVELLGRRTQRPATDVTLDHVGSLANPAIVISRLHAGEKRLVFCDSRARVESLAVELRQRDVSTFVSHSSLAVDERRRAETAFAEARDCVIVATSTLELGIDVGDLDRVIQIDGPPTVASFLQRLGRAGRRAGSSRNMMLLTTGEGIPLLQAAGLLHLWSTGFVEPVEAPPLPLHLLAHQLLAFAIQEGRIGRNLWQDVLGRLPAYAQAIESGDADQIVEHLVATGMLVDDGGMLSVGPQGERSYGFRHFIELTSVFTSPPIFIVRHGANELGHLDPQSLLTNDRSYATVLLAGRSWKITSIDWKRHFAWVEPVEQHGRSRWSGTGRGLGPELCDAMREVARQRLIDPTGVRRVLAELHLDSTPDPASG